MKKHLVPDWACKCFLIAACMLFTGMMAAKVIRALESGEYIAKYGRVISATEAPTRFVSGVAGMAFAAFCLSLMTIGSLGWIPPVGRFYKRLLRGLHRK